MRRVYVTNIPIHAYGSAWVDVPEGTPDESLNREVAKVLLEGSEVPKGVRETVLSGELGLDQRAIEDGWEFTISMEKARP